MPGCGWGSPHRARILEGKFTYMSNEGHNRLLARAVEAQRNFELARVERVEAFKAANRGHVSQQEIADNTGLSRTKVSEITRGKRT